jgi:hypothetical protein
MKKVIVCAAFAMSAASAFAMPCNQVGYKVGYAVGAVATAAPRVVAHELNNPSLDYPVEVAGNTAYITVDAAGTVVACGIGTVLDIGGKAVDTGLAIGERAADTAGAVADGIANGVGNVLGAFGF